MSKADRTIEIALAGVREELAKHQAGSGTVSAPEQLQRFEQELMGMLEDLRQDTFTPQRTGMAHTVVDSWPLRHSLTDQICAAVNAYSRAIGHGK